MEGRKKVTKSVNIESINNFDDSPPFHVTHQRQVGGLSPKATKSTLSSAINKKRRA